MTVETLCAWAAARAQGWEHDPAARTAAVEATARRTLRRLEVTVRITGAPPLVDGPALWVANHVSWLDVYALNAVAGCRFVAKSEVAAWPIVGDTARRHGTFFLVRRNLRDAARVKDAVAAALGRGERVAAFPEGTTTDGGTVRPFFAALLQAAVDADVPVQPVALRYRDAAGRRSDAAPFVDDATFLASFGRVVAAPVIAAELVFGPPLASAALARRELAHAAESFVARALELPSPLRARPRALRRHVA